LTWVSVPQRGECPCGAVTSGPRRRCRSCVSRERALAKAQAPWKVAAREFTVAKRAEGRSWASIAAEIETRWGFRPGRTTMWSWVKERRPELLGTVGPGRRATVAGLKRQIERQAREIKEQATEAEHLKACLDALLEMPPKASVVGSERIKIPRRIAEQVRA